MPNHVTNQIIFEDSATLLRVAQELRTKDSVLGSLDFNKLIPMPESLNIETSSRTNEGLKLYTAHLKGGPSFATKDPVAWELGKQAYENLEKYGATTWYDWCVDNWGTKWNSYNAVPVSEGDCTMQFDTAWSAVAPIIKALSEKYPDERITYRWADEDIGHNVGWQVYQNGEIVESELFTGGSKEAYEFAAEVLGIELDEFNLYLSADGSGYEFLEDNIPPKQPSKETKDRGDAR